MSPDRAEIAWAAGIFEGEGCIYQGTGVGLVINMTDKDVLERFAAIVGVGRIRGPIAGQKANHKSFWEWRVGRQADREAVLLAFMPWLGQRRRDKAERMLAMPRATYGKSWITHCSAGHPLEGPDAELKVWINEQGRLRRRCNVCNRENQARYRARVRARTSLRQAS